MSGHNTLQEKLQGDALLLDPGNGKTFNVDRDDAFIRLVSGASNESRILPTPSRIGQVVNIAMATDGGGDIAVTQTGSLAFNQAANTTITFNDAGDTVTLVAIAIASALRWRIKSNDGATLS